MTTLLSPISNFAIPTLGTISRLACSLNQYRAAKAQKARAAKHVKLLAELDTHMLNDIGLKGFNRLAAEEQESLLLKTIQSCA